MISSAQARVSAPIFLLEVFFAGQSFCWSTGEFVENIDKSGRLRVYSSGLNFQFTDQIYLGGRPAARSIPLELLWPEPINELMNAGHDLGAATGEFSVWIDGTRYEDRVVLCRGIVSDPIVGNDEEPVQFSLEERDTEDNGRICDDDEFVSATTWPDAAAQGKGTPYPWVFGSPGRFNENDGSVEDAGATPARVVKATGGVVYLLIAGHPTIAGRDAGVVRVNNAELAEWQNMVALHVTDGLGRTVTVVDANTYFTRGTNPWTIAHIYAVSWADSGGGIQRRDSDEVATGAGSVLAAILAKSTQRVDWGRTYAAVPWLDRFKLGGFFDTATATQCIDALLPLLPAAFGTGPNGIYPWAWRYDADRSEVIATLVEGQDGVSPGTIRWEGRDDVANELCLAYAFGRQRNAYRRRRTLTGDATRVSDVDKIVTKYAVNSRGRYGMRYRRIDAQWVYREDTAAGILKWLSRRYGQAFRSLRIGLPLSWVWLLKGSFVRVVLDRGIDAVGWVRSVVYTPGAMVLDVLLRPEDG